MTSSYWSSLARSCWTAHLRPRGMTARSTVWAANQLHTDVLVGAWLLEAEGCRDAALHPAGGLLCADAAGRHGGHTVGRPAARDVGPDRAGERAATAATSIHLSWPRLRPESALDATREAGIVTLCAWSPPARARTAWGFPILAAPVPCCPGGHPPCRLSWATRCTRCHRLVRSAAHHGARGYAEAGGAAGGLLSHPQQRPSTARC